MNKENKTINLVLRIGIILTWVMSNVSLFMLFSGMKNIDTNGLDEKNFPERLFKVISDFADKVTLYYVVIGLVAFCLVFSIITRYKTKMVSFVFKIIILAITLVSMLSGLEYINALGSCKGLSNLTYSGFNAESVASALTAAGFSGSDVQDIAKTLTDKEAAGNALGGYFFPILVLFILSITSIHCLVKHNDPNKKNSEEN